MDARELLRQYAAGQRIFRCNDPNELLTEGIDLKSIDLQDADLKGIDLKSADLSCSQDDDGYWCPSRLDNANLSGAILKYGNLRDAILQSTNLRDADLSHARLFDANLSHANLTHADLSHADLEEANLSSANLSGANLAWANLNKANLSSANLSNADLNKAELNGANLNKANLRSAILIDAELEGADLCDAVLSNADLSNAYLVHANLSGAVIDETTKIDDEWRLVWEIVNQRAKERNLSGKDLSEANLIGADLSQANLRDANLSGADLSRADLSGADLSGTDLSGVELNWANLTGAVVDKNTKLADKWRRVLKIVNKEFDRKFQSYADLSQTNLSGSDLKGVYLDSANLRGADLRGADLKDAYLNSADLRGANLSSAKLSGADLKEANLIRANLKGADLSNADLRNANLQEADLTDTNRNETKFPDTRLFTDMSFIWSEKIDGNEFERFVHAILLRESGVKRVRRVGTDNESDGGRDLMAVWRTLLPDQMLKSEQNPYIDRNIIVQCKAHKKAVNRRIFPAIRDTIEHYNADGYFIVVSSDLTTELTEHLEKLRNGGKYWVEWWTRSEIEDRLRANLDIVSRFPNIVQIQ